MSYNKNGFYYDQQIKRHIAQFMAIFTDLRVQVGKWNTESERLISVPIKYAAPDRVVAAILAGNTQNAPLRLPIMSAYMRSLEMAQNLYAGQGMERRQTYVPVGGLVPNDVKVVHQLKPVPYRAEFDLNIYTSNTDQMFQILEQILPMFDPSLTIQTSDSFFDWARLTVVELTRMSFDSNYPIDSEQRVVQVTLSFTVPIYLSTPAQVKTDFVQKVFARIAAVSSEASSSYEIIAEIDAQGISYVQVDDASTPVV